ncbi:hypothetical protein C5167_032757 [Papaver somniferum]|uniref:Uncharacterized protein n=1 Tax=Papaver somniferum TaxID=3469 RepID=A0A4Y7KA05_PAPSO|nr:hypothetical protein C5167_032757 [Papaver somniferum]
MRNQVTNKIISLQNSDHLKGLHVLKSAIIDNSSTASTIFSILIVISVNREDKVTSGITSMKGTIIGEIIGLSFFLFPQHDLQDPLMED